MQPKVWLAILNQFMESHEENDFQIYPNWGKGQ
jgi:hypothetical protein